MTRKYGSPIQTVSAIAVIDLANELLNLSYVSEDYLGKIGPEFNALYLAYKENKPIQEERLPESLLTDLWTEASISNTNSDVGLMIGYKVNNQAKGVLANWLFQCDTLADVFTTFSRNIHLLNPSEYWEKTVEGDNTKLRLMFKSDNYPSIAVDRSMAAIVSWGSALIGSEIKPVSASFTRPVPKSIERYETIFGKYIYFEREENAIEFPNAMFDSSVKAANPYLKSLLEKQASEIGSALDTRSSVSGKVNALLANDLPGFCQIDSVCQVLHLSRSTLYRKLKSEGLSYTDLVKNARINKIKSMEKRSESHGEIAEALGFSDIGSYYRFRKEACMPD